MTVVPPATGPWSGAIPVTAGGTGLPTARPNGPDPVGTVAVTVLVAVSITDTVFDVLLVTYTTRPDGSAAMPIGRMPTGTDAILRLVETSTTDTALSRVSAL